MRNISKNGNDVSNNHSQRPPFDGLIAKKPYGESANLFCKVPLKFEVAHLPSNLPHIDAGLLPEIKICTQEINAKNAAPNWKHP